MHKWYVCFWVSTLQVLRSSNRDENRCNTRKRLEIGLSNECEPLGSEAEAAMHYCFMREKMSRKWTAR